MRGHQCPARRIDWGRRIRRPRTVGCFQCVGQPPSTSSAIDFEALAKRFATATRKSVELEQLKAAVRGQLNKLIRVNKTRADYLAKFEELIESYNAGSRNIDELFQELLALSRDLSDEEQRHVREHLTEDELTVFDLLTRPGSGSDDRRTRGGEKGRSSPPGAGSSDARVGLASPRAGQGAGAARD